MKLVDYCRYCPERDGQIIGARRCQGCYIPLHSLEIRYCDPPTLIPGPLDGVVVMCPWCGLISSWRWWWRTYGTLCPLCKHEAAIAGRWLALWWLLTGGPTLKPSTIREYGGPVRPFQLS